MSKSAPLSAKTLEIHWHVTEVEALIGETKGRKGAKGPDLHSLPVEPKPIQAVAFHPTAPSRFASLGDDQAVRVWELNTDAVPQFLNAAGLRGMDSVAACVTSIALDEVHMSMAWSPAGHMIAVGAVSGSLGVYWHDPDEAPEPPMRERWVRRRRFGNHASSVFGVAFSPDAAFLISVSHGGTVLVHNMASMSTTPVWSMNDMHRSARAVAWDPWGRLVATFGTQPSLKVCTVASKKDTGRLHLTNQLTGPNGLHLERDTTASLCIGFSPDGMLLAAPFGKSRSPECSRCIYVYSREAFEKPVVRLGVREGMAGAVLGVAWAPGFFEVPDRVRQQPVMERLPWGPATEYMLALALWTSEAVVVYTTSSSGRHAFFNDLHVQPITSVAWSPDSRFLLTASLDCFISIAHFAEAIGTFHRTLAFVPAPSACALLHRHLSALAAEAAAFEERTACAVKKSTEVNVVVPKKKRRPEKVEPTAAEVTEAELATLLEQAEAGTVPPSAPSS